VRVTKAEQQALEAVLRHGTAKGAALALGKSTRTVEQQLASARERLDVTTTIEAVRVVFTDIGK
jgi:FixJ family two-component response regulator